MSRVRPLLPRRRASLARRQRSAAEIQELLASAPYRSERSVVPAAVAAEQEWPRLRVHRDAGVWRWSITGPDGRLLGTDVAPTQPAALALGHAVLELVSMAWALGVGQVDAASA